MRLWRKGSLLTFLVGMRTDLATVENSVEGPPEVKKRGSLGVAVVWCLSLAQGAILETRDRIPHWDPGTLGLLLPLPVSQPLCVTIIKII